MRATVSELTGAPRTVAATRAANRKFGKSSKQVVDAMSGGDPASSFAGVIATCFAPSGRDGAAEATACARPASRRLSQAGCEPGWVRGGELRRRCPDASLAVWRAAHPADAKLIVEIGANSRDTADKNAALDERCLPPAFEPLLGKWATLLCARAPTR